jgi:two-component system OmpR family response regulator
MPKNIAIVEDEPAIRDNYSAAFSRQGYKVSGYSDRKQALEAFSVRLPDLVIIDVNLGDETEGGFDLCRELRTRSPELPIIFLTAMDSELDVISGLRLGADDYLTKDISISQILARVGALFRRVEALSQPVTNEQKLVQGQLELDVDRLSAHWAGKKIPLSLTEFWLIHALARFPGHVKNRQQLMDAANTVLDDNTITSHIKRIRHKFCEVDAGFEAIETVYGMGYRWVEA